MAKWFATFYVASVGALTIVLAMMWLYRDEEE
jgi:hypothetical protein